MELSESSTTIIPPLSEDLREYIQEQMQDISAIILEFLQYLERFDILEKEVQKKVRSDLFTVLGNKLLSFSMTFHARRRRAYSSTVTTLENSGFNKVNPLLQFSESASSEEESSANFPPTPIRTRTS